MYSTILDMRSFRFSKWRQYKLLWCCGNALAGGLNSSANIIKLVFAILEISDDLLLHPTVIGSNHTIILGQSLFYMHFLTNVSFKTTNLVMNIPGFKEVRFGCSFQASFSKNKRKKACTVLCTSIYSLFNFSAVYSVTVQSYTWFNLDFMSEMNTNWSNEWTYLVRLYTKTGWEMTGNILIITLHYCF